MKNRETARFAICASPCCTIRAREACIITGLENVDVEALQLTATIGKNFQELGI